MFVLDRAEFRAVDMACIGRFVECWERYYTDDDREYFEQINVGKDLTEDNLTRLLRWKDPRMLTHPRKADGAPNPRVTQVLAQIDSLNRFRRGDSTADEFQAITQKIFPNGIIWQLFLFHLARPADWPIADRHVFRSYSVLFNARAPDSIAAFGSYSNRFRELAAEFRRRAAIEDTDEAAIVRTNKRLDNALFAFGQFLDAYDR